MNHEFDQPGEQLQPEISQEIGEMALNATDIEQTPSEIEQFPSVNHYEKFEQDRFIKEVPFIKDQRNDISRTNQITYITGQTRTRGTTTADESYVDLRRELTEYEALVELDAFLERAENELGEPYSENARLMREQLTFIGKKEYDEAVEGIAAHWKQMLDAEPDMMMVAISGFISSMQIKSDDYLLENVLSRFSDEEREKYKGRLSVDFTELANADPERTRVVLLDDWTISGQQLRTVHQKVAEQYPQMENSIEIQLITASQSKIKDGLIYKYNGHEDKIIPVKAYFKAHVADFANPENDASITSYYSSVDLYFETVIRDMVSGFHKLGDLSVVMPPLTNIVRTYHEGEMSRGYKKLPQKLKWLS